MTDQTEDSTRPGEEPSREAAASVFDAAVADGTPPARARHESAATLRTVVDMVRRITSADTASVASFSLTDQTVTWQAMSGFRTRVSPSAKEVAHPLRGEVARRVAAAERMMILRGVGVHTDLPVEEFPLHSAEGVRDVAMVPLRARGETLGALVVGYRTAHRFTAGEKKLLEGLAEMAALALDNARLVETVGTAKKVWEQTFDAIPDGIVVHDDRALVVRCNVQAAEMMGFDHPAKAIGMSLADAFGRLFGERAAAYHLRQGTGTTSSFEMQAEDGRRYIVSVAPLTSLKSVSWEARIERQEITDARTPDAQTPDTGLQTFWSVVTWSDITELSEIQEQLARSRRLATVGQLAAGVAHEINNPLAAVTTCAEATLRGLRSTPELAAVAEERNWIFYLEEIVRQALHCKAITRGLLDLSRQRRARREAGHLNALVERTARFFETHARERGASVEVSLDERVGEVMTDESMVRQIIDNLLNNALDALDARAGGGRITVSTALDGERLIVEVADDGPGIPHDVLARVFDPFFTTKESGRGSGLGLPVSLTLAEAVGGALTVESKLGAGSRFRLWIPRRTPERKDEG
ncbi:MAG: ATP-binding protein [Pyrinomonadaceae bacterium]